MRDPVVLEQDLERKAARMDFFQVLRLVEAANPALPRIGASLRARDDALRLGQDPSMAFAGAALQRFTAASGEARARLAVNFFGLLGANGPLPLHLTEYTRERLRNEGDGTLLAFLDVFHHRMLSLFYRTRAQAEPAISLDREHEDRFADFVGSLFGIGAPALRQRDEIGDFAKLHFAGLLANKSRPAGALAAILGAYFRVPVRVEQFCGHWMRLPDELQTRIGRGERGNRLGVSAVLGRAVWDCQHKFRIVIGPLGIDDYQRLLPGGAAMRKLVAWVRQYAGDTLDWDVRLVLKKEQVPPLKLGGGLRLGWSSWPMSVPAARDPAQLIINPRAHAG